MEDTFKTICRPVRKKIAVNACRFISSLSPCSCEEEAKSFIQGVRDKFHDATHSAFAYRVREGGEIMARSNDDGEPAGTAGPPMLSALEKAGLTNVVTVGTRYFGGVKLGVGGLIRAYRGCAEAGLKEADFCIKTQTLSVQATVSYENLGSVLKDIAAVEAELSNIDYGETVMVTIRLRNTAWPYLQKRIKDSTRGAVTFAVIDK